MSCVNAQWTQKVSTQVVSVGCISAHRQVVIIDPAQVEEGREEGQVQRATVCQRKQPERCSSKSRMGVCITLWCSVPWIGAARPMHFMLCMLS